MNLSFAVPSTILGSGGTLNTFLRVRLAPATTQLNPTGLSTGGEVEDYRLVAGTPRVPATASWHRRSPRPPTTT